MYEPTESRNSQADKHQPAATPVMGVNQNTRCACVNQNSQHPAGNIPAAVRRIVRATARAIKRVMKKKKPGVALWVAIGRAVNRGEAQLRNTEAHRSYGVQFTTQVAAQSRIHVRKAFHCSKLAVLFNNVQAARLAVAAPSWRVTRDVMAYLGDGQDPQRLATLMEHIPEDAEPAGRKALAQFLQQHHRQRCPLSADRIFIVVDDNGQVNCRLMPLKRAKALAKGRKVMMVAPATA